MSNINELLKDVNLANKNSKLAKIPGEDFNIFQILDLKELGHSKFIAELLDPDGSHGMGSIFLEIFLKNLEIYDFSIDGVDVRTEKPIDYSKEYNSSGRIDIFLENNKYQHILIENKIDARDLENQLAKYREAYPRATIIYLTLYGRKPNELSTNGKVKTKNISYEKKIISWLEQCKEKVADFPLLLKPIIQYINVLKNLTGQPRRKYMSDETIEVILKSPENVKSALEIAEGVNDIKEGIVLKYFVPDMKKLAEKHKLTFWHSEENDCIEGYWGRKPWGISLSNDKLKENQISIYFQFDEKELKYLVCGFCINEESADKAKEIYKEKNPLRDHIKEFGKEFGEISEPHWLCKSKLYAQLQTEQLVDLVSENSKVIKECEEKITDLLKLLEEFEAKG